MGEIGLRERRIYSRQAQRTPRCVHVRHSEHESLGVARDARRIGIAKDAPQVELAPLLRLDIHQRQDGLALAATAIDCGHRKAMVQSHTGADVNGKGYVKP